MSIEAMKLALDALDMVKTNADDWQERTGKEIKGWMQPVNNSITALRQAIEQAQKQEPVMVIGENESMMCRTLPTGTKLYTSPPQRQPLTDEQIKIIWRDIDGSDGMLMRFARSIEAAHGIKGEA